MSNSDSVYMLTGDDVSALQSAATRITGARGHGVSNSAAGLSVGTDRRTETSLAVDIQLRRFKVKQVKDDYLVCRTWNGTTEGTTDVNIAKPWDLRKTPFVSGAVNGITYSSYTVDNSASQRSATDGTNTETQVITPPYFVDCEITAVAEIEGGTSLTVSSKPIVWTDINVAGRAWAKKFGT